jgi:hypothetical protein
MEAMGAAKPVALGRQFQSMAPIDGVMGAPYDWLH